MYRLFLTFLFVAAVNGAEIDGICTGGTPAATFTLADFVKEKWYELYSTSKNFDCTQMLFTEKEKNGTWKIVDLAEKKDDITWDISYNDDASFILNEIKHNILAYKKEDYAIIHSCNITNSGNPPKSTVNTWILSAQRQLNATSVSEIFSTLNGIRNELILESLESVNQLAAECSGASLNVIFTSLLVIGVALTRLF